MSAEASSRSGGALLLAAGFSRRFGSDKRRQQLPDGRTLLEATVIRYSEVFQHVCVVLRAEDEDLARTVRALPGNPEIAIAEDAELGMGHSLAAGMRCIVDQSPEPWQWVAIGLGDMPFVRAETLIELRALFMARGDRIVQPVYENRAGHPVFFPGEQFTELLQLSGDQGARSLLRNNPKLTQHSVSDPGVLADVDTPAALADSIDRL